MAEARWIEKTVDTAGRPCPLIRGDCPGHRRGCAFWLDEILEQGDNGKTMAQGGCGLMWLYAIQHEVRNEAIRTQGSLDKTATEIREATQAVTTAGRGVAAALILTKRAAIENGPHNHVPVLADHDCALHGPPPCGMTR